MVEIWLKICMEFEWDPHKARKNKKKHGVSFEEAASCFSDPLGKDFYDPDSSEEEDRFILLARSFKGRMLVVVYTERKGKIRIISARKATKKEERFFYEKGI